MRIALLVPAPFATVSGGYNYDRAIVAGLRAAGHSVDVLELAGRHPLADAAAMDAAQHAWTRLAADAVPVIDGLCLPAFAPLADALAARRTAGLIHHPTALETGHDGATRDALRAIERDLLPRLARVIVTSSTSCLIQLARGLRKYYPDARVVHLSEYVLGALENRNGT